MFQIFGIYGMHLLETLIPHLILYFYVFTALGEQICWKNLLKVVGIAVFPAVITYDVLSEALELPALLVHVLSSAMVFFTNVFLVKWLWKRSFWWSFALIGIGGVLQVATTQLANRMTKWLSIVFREISFTFLELIVMTLLLVLTFFIRKLLYRIHFDRMFTELLEEESRIRKTALWIFVLELTIEIFPALWYKAPLMTYITSVAILILFLLCIVMYLGRQRENERKLRLQEAMLLQQQHYLENLEEMQKEVRAFRHDYKNILAGMYLDAEAGEVEKIRETLKQLELNFDRKLGEKIRQTGQVGNIRIPELKSLVLSKLMQMEQKKLSCRLEVFYPVTETGMEVWDLTRCLGILLDNAMEAAREVGSATEERKGPSVELLLMRQEKFFTVRVENVRKKEGDMAKIWEEGYSTKGKGRGMGLSSYQRILQRYPEASFATSWTDDRFIQELTVEL